MTYNRNFPEAEFTRIVKAVQAGETATRRLKTHTRAKTVRGYFYTWRKRAYPDTPVRVELKGARLTFGPPGTPLWDEDDL